MTKQKISPFLWFDQQAEEAANFYVSIFPDSAVETIVRYPEARVLTVAFRLNGQQFTALNGGPKYKFTEAVSFLVDCETQAESRPLLGPVVRRRPANSMRLGER